MQTEISQTMDLLDESGKISREGYAKLPFWRYEREDIRAPWWRIKEWDYYAVIDEKSGKGITITFSDFGYAGLFALCFVDIEKGIFRQYDTLKLLTRGKAGLAADADTPHELFFEDKKLSLRLSREEDSRRLSFSSGRVEGEIVLKQPADQERMVIATSWAKKRTAFYYNQKINCMPAEGSAFAEGEEIRFEPKTSFGVLDWGRGRWTYRNRWYWASASGTVGRIPFGFNLGYGFSDRTPASENMLFYDRRAHKLEEVRFNYDPEDLLKPWSMSSGDGRLELEFFPRVDRFSDANVLIVRSLQHQLFGYYSGHVLLEDGSKIELSRLPGFVEDVYNRW
ncbi:MAG: DUF2804 domain-containing protein [Spirochaetia bacterium]